MIPIDKVVLLYGSLTGLSFYAIVHYIRKMISLKKILIAIENDF